MAGSRAMRVLIVDDEPSLIQDYQYILSARPEAGDPGSLSGKLERDLFGTAVGRGKFPEVSLTACHQGRDAVEEVRAAQDEGRPFTLAFIDMYLAPDLDGIQTAEQIRALDPDVHVVLVSARAEVHPVEMSERVPPADQLFFVSKPFHAAEIQQLVLALAARWRGERWQFGGGRSRAGGLPEVLDRLPAGALVFDRRDRLLAANDAMGELFPELAELFVAGTSYEEIQRGAAERLDGPLNLVAAQRDDEGGGMLQIRAHTHLGHGDRSAGQIRVADVVALQNARQRVAQLLADTQLPRARRAAGSRRAGVSCHCLSVAFMGRSQSMAPGTLTSRAAGAPAGAYRVRATSLTSKHSMTSPTWTSL